MYLFPVSDGRQKRTYNNLDTLVINRLLSPAVAIRSKQMTLPACHKRHEKELTCALRTHQSLLRRCRLCIEVGGRRAFDYL
jgi:hypothetical protein